MFSASVNGQGLSFDADPAGGVLTFPTPTTDIKITPQGERIEGGPFGLGWDPLGGAEVATDVILFEDMAGAAIIPVGPWIVFPPVLPVWEVDVPHVASGKSVFVQDTPAVQFALTAPFLASGAFITSDQFEFAVELYPPTLQDSLNAPGISAQFTSVLPAVASGARQLVPNISTEVALYAPTLASGAQIKIGTVLFTSEIELPAITSGELDYFGVLYFGDYFKSPYF